MIYLIDLSYQTTLLLIIRTMTFKVVVLPPFVPVSIGSLASSQLCAPILGVMLSFCRHNTPCFGVMSVFNGG